MLPKFQILNSVLAPAHRCFEKHILHVAGARRRDIESFFNRKSPVRSRRESFMKRMLLLVAVLALAQLAVVPALAQTSPPVIVSSVGYLNGTPLTAHTSTAFNSTGASTLVAFVSTNTPWNGLPVSISGLSDSPGNTWNLLTGPTVFSGRTFTLLSAVYYVNNPVSSATHTVTVQLTNPAPLVFRSEERRVRK